MTLGCQSEQRLQKLIFPQEVNFANRNYGIAEICQFFNIKPTVEGGKQVWRTGQELKFIKSLDALFEQRLVYFLEHYHKYCSHSVGRDPKRSFWVFASFRLSHRAATNLLLRQSLAKTQKSSLRMATVFLQTL